MSPLWLLWVIFMAGVIALLIMELNKRQRATIQTPTSESQPEFQSVRWQGLKLRLPLGSLIQLWGRLQSAVAQHPIPLYGWLETIFWLVILFTLLDHLRDPRGSTTSFVVWLLTIGPHEVGHFICNPFGVFIMFLGGSIWQLLFWLLLTAWSLFVRKQISVALLMLTIMGHSFINLAQYIGDAQAKQLPLLFGQDSSHHDWANILGMLNLLPADHALALISTLIGVVLVIGCALIGILTAWFLPRVALGRMALRVAGNPIIAVRASILGQ
ncbi:MAG: hypothetical protein KF726_15740 [Anaerolineae bacterium]|nr:hypothetical protein [Anaerolineae bacterium]